MPQTRPHEISDCVSLSDKLRTLVRGFVSKACAVDALLPRIINESSPDKEGIGFPCAEHDFFTRAAE